MPIPPFLSPSLLYEKVQAKDKVLLFDCRYNLFDPSAGRLAYETGHIPGAYYLHPDEDLSGEIISGVTGRHPLPSQSDFVALMNRHGLTPDTLVVAYDDKNAGIAARLWWMCHWIGHKNVVVLEKGFPAWKAAGYPLETGVNHPESLDQISVYPLASLVTKHNWQKVDKLRNDNAFTLVDSRTAPRYRGEEEPIDPVAGHIEGAINLPWPDNLENGCFKSRSVLRARFSKLGKEASQNVFYCGSGVTACHNILAYYFAFGEMPGLYPGSWSDWITKPGFKAL